MSVVTVSQGLADAIKYLPDIVGSDPTVPGNVTPPHFYVAEVALSRRRTFGGVVDGLFMCRLLVSASSGPEQQTLLKRYMRETGKRSVVQHIEAEPTLGGACGDLVVMEIRGHRMYRIGPDALFYGAEWPVRVIGIRDDDDMEDED